MRRGHSLSSRVATCREHTRRLGRKPDVILFLAASLDGASQLALEREYAAIESELRMAPNRADFELCSRWAVGVDEMARHLMELQPTVIHFSGHGLRGTPRHGRSASRTRDVGVAAAYHGGICLRNEHGGVHVLTAHGLARVINSSTSSARVVVLNACYSNAHARRLCGVVDCVVGMSGPIPDHDARCFAAGFYRALGNRRSVGQALDHAVAMLDANRLASRSRPRLRTRTGIDPDQLVLTPAPESGHCCAGAGRLERQP
jgi:hypothetical protein